MTSSTTVVLHGAATPLGEQLLLKLALAGFEVTAQVPPAPWQGRTGEYAAHVTVDPVAEAVAHSVGDTIVVVAADVVPIADVEAALAHATRIERWVQCAPRHTDVTAVAAALQSAKVPLTLVRHEPLMGRLQDAARRTLRRTLPLSAWLATWAPPRTAADEATVATAAVHALQRRRAAVDVGGTTVTMSAVLHATAQAEALRPWWLPLVGGRRSSAPPLRLRSQNLPSSPIH